MTDVRIAHAEPRPGNLGNGIFITRGYLVVLADDTGHRALPVWFRGHPGGGSLAKLMGRETDDIAPAGAAGVAVSGGSDWTAHEVTAMVPEDADLIRFGIALAGPGQVALRHAELTRRA